MAYFLTHSARSQVRKQVQAEFFQRTDAVITSDVKFREIFGLEIFHQKFHDGFFAALNSPV